jgi:hypothetical protein
VAFTYNDKYILSTDPTFGNRVMAGLTQLCTFIGNEGWGINFHRERQRYASGVLNAPLSFKAMFVNAAANDTSVINDATVNGTVALIAGNVATQAALITDVHIDGALQNAFNAFFPTPG